MSESWKEESRKAAQLRKAARERARRHAGDRTSMVLAQLRKNGEWAFFFAPRYLPDLEARIRLVVGRQSAEQAVVTGLRELADLLEHELAHPLPGRGGSFFDSPIDMSAGMPDDVDEGREAPARKDKRDDDKG